MTTTNVNITAKDQTAGAFASVDRRLSGIAGTARGLTTAFGALGVGMLAIGGVRTLRGIIDAQDALAKLSVATSLSIETLAGLEFATSQTGTSVERSAKAVRQFSQIILNAEGETSKYVKIIKALGLNLEELKRATPEEQLLSFADAIKNNVREQERAAVVTSILGDRYTELLPLLVLGRTGIEGLIAKGQELNPVTAESAAQAEIFNDSLDTLSRSLARTGVSITANILPALADITSRMAAATEQGGLFQGVMAGVDGVFRKIATSGDFGEGILGPLGYMIAREEKLKDLAKQANATADATEEAQKGIEGAITPKSTTQPRSFVDVLREIEGQADKVRGAAAGAAETTRVLAEQERQAQATAQRIDQLNNQYDPLIRRNKELAEVAELASLGLSKTAIDNAHLDIITRYIDATTEVVEGVKDIDDATLQLADTTQTVFDTNEQIIISSVRRIQGSLADGLFNFFDDGLSGMVSGVKNAVGRMISEFVSIKLLQASGLGSLFGTASASTGGSSGGGNLLSLASTGSSLLNLGGGLSGLFASGAGTAFTAGAGGAGTAFIGGAGTALGGSGVGAGAGATASLGATGWGLLAVATMIGNSLVANNKSIGGLNSRQANSLGSTFDSPLGFAGSVSSIGTGRVVGDLIGGSIGRTINKFIPDPIAILTGLFGRGAPKFNREELVGTVGSDGFSGVLNTGIKEKGGLLRSSRYSNLIADTDTGELLNQFGRLSESGNFPKGLLDATGDTASTRAREVGAFLDETFTTLSDTLKSTADILGISSDSLKTFNAQLDLTSEKGESLSEAQIGDAIADISDQMVRGLVPSIDELSKVSESTTDTLGRLSADFQAVETGFLLAGDSLQEARKKAQGLDFAGRSSITDEFGGAAGLQAELQSFFDNVLDGSAQLDIVGQRVKDALKPIGIDFIPTLEQLAEAFRSGNPELQKQVLLYDELIVQYHNLSDTVEEVVSDISRERSAFTAGRREAQAGNLEPTIATTIGGKIFTADEIRAGQQAAVDETRDRLRDLTQEQIGRINAGISLVDGQIANIKQASDFFDQFKSAALDLAGTNFTAARQQVAIATQLARAGASIELIDTPELAQAIGALKEDRSQFFSSRKEFEQERARTVSEISELSLSGKSNAEKQLDVLTSQLSVLEKSLLIHETTLSRIDTTQGLPGAAGTLSDAELVAQQQQAGRGLFESLRIQAGTTFNGSVQFADAFGRNESADAQALSRFGSLVNPTAPAGAQSQAVQELRQEIKELREQLQASGNTQNNLFNLFNNLARGGDSLRVQTV